MCFERFTQRKPQRLPELSNSGSPPAEPGVSLRTIKQTLQLADFLGNSANAVRWQVWTALLTYVLLRFCAWLSQWGHSFTRLFALLRSAVWQKLELRSLWEVYGTAGGGGRFLGTPQQAYLAGFA